MKTNILAEKLQHASDPIIREAAVACAERARHRDLVHRSIELRRIRSELASQVATTTATAARLTMHGASRNAVARVEARRERLVQGMCEVNEALATIKAALNDKT